MNADFVLGVPLGDSSPLNRFTRLWSPSGTVTRGTYAIVGLLGFTLKHNVDRFVASFAFHRHCGIFNYWVPVRDVARVTQLPRSEAGKT